VKLKLNFGQGFSAKKVSQAAKGRRKSFASIILTKAGVSVRT
jgi:hypothetical protein